MFYLSAVVILVLAFGGCLESGSSAGCDVASPSYSERGEASYYADSLAGNPTANGETYDPSRLTAAHRTLPFGTVLCVTNLSNGRSVEVTVNDRGPFVEPRVIDLSRRAAEALDLVQMGHAAVQIDSAKYPLQTKGEAALPGSVQGKNVCGPGSRRPI